MLWRRIDRMILRILAVMLFVVFLVYGIRTYHSALGSRLLQAAASGNTSRVKLLLALGADINARSDTVEASARELPRPSPTAGLTALELAIKSNHFDTAEALLKHGAKPNTNAQSLLTQQTDPNVVFDLIAGGMDYKEVFESAVFINNAKLVKAMLDRYPDLMNTVESKGMLLDAVKAGKAVKLPPNNADWHDALSSVLYRMGKTQEAADESRRAIQLNPNDGVAYVSLGWFLMELGQTDEALDACRRAVALRPGDANAHANLGKALTLQGKSQEAIQECNQALTLDPGDVEARYDLGLALAKDGQAAQAKAELQTYVRLAEGNAVEKERLADAIRHLKQ